MRSFSLFSLLLAVSGAGATPTPATTCASSANNAFGMPKSGSGLTSSSSSSSSPLHVRGGEVLQPDSVEEVEAIILNAANNNQLVVVDFTASWYVPVQ
jgi:hypothetical protein